ncbi:MAG: hypothetical protein K2J39_00735 [Ruminococcus sp.]|nr:hypothetical protein [Ruminococcus sp.]
MTLWESFLEMISDKNNLADYKTYYSAIVQWTKERINLFTDKIIEDNDFNLLLNLDINEYVIDNPEICLETEYERLKKLNLNTRSLVAMFISDTLREMVTLKSGIDCPNCKYNEMSFYIAEIYSEKRIIMICDVCGWCDNENNEHIKNILPASKNELRKFNT